MNNVVGIAVRHGYTPLTPLGANLAQIACDNYPGTSFFGRVPHTLARVAHICLQLANVGVAGCPIQGPSLGLELGFSFAQADCRCCHRKIPHELRLNGAPDLTGPPPPPGTWGCDGYDRRPFFAASTRNFTVSAFLYPCANTMFAMSPLTRHRPVQLRLDSNQGLANAVPDPESHQISALHKNLTKCAF